MFIVDEKDEEYRFGDNGPKYLMKGPRMNYALVQFTPGTDFTNHYHKIMEENFYVIEGEIDIVVDGTLHHLTEGQFIHIEPNERHYVINRSSKITKLVSTLAPHVEVDKFVDENPDMSKFK